MEEVSEETNEDVDEPASDSVSEMSLDSLSALRDKQAIGRKEGRPLDWDCSSAAAAIAEELREQTEFIMACNLRAMGELHVHLELGSH
jgi:hypothetical protein